MSEEHPTDPAPPRLDMAQEQSFEIVMVQKTDAVLDEISDLRKDLAQAERNRDARIYDLERQVRELKQELAELKPLLHMISNYFEAQRAKREAPP